jgi:hypothetical protein
MNDEILEIIGNAVEGHFGCVDSVPGAVYVGYNGKVYSISVTECVGYDDDDDGDDDCDGDDVI